MRERRIKRGQKVFQGGTHKSRGVRADRRGRKQCSRNNEQCSAAAAEMVAAGVSLEGPDPVKTVKSLEYNAREHSISPQKSEIMEATNPLYTYFTTTL